MGVDHLNMKEPCFVTIDPVLSPAMAALTSWDNLLFAWQEARRDKRSKPGVAAFEFDVTNQLLELQTALQNGTWRSGGYRHFFIHEPKRRRISAAPFADRVVHHALVQATAARFEHDFIGDSFANRVGKGTHAAIQRLKHFSQRYTYCLRLDVRQHFASVDHQILKSVLRKRIPEDDLFALTAHIIDSGADIHTEHTPQLLAGDDLLDLARPMGLPMGNLTSQFWSNCYLDGLDQFIKRGLRVPAYLRYVDDMALFGNNKDVLREQGKRIQAFCAQRLRLCLHTHSAQTQWCTAGTPWLGFVVYPTHIKVKARKVVESTRKLQAAYQQSAHSEEAYNLFAAKVQAWSAHVQQADTWGLQRHLLLPFYT